MSAKPSQIYSCGYTAVATLTGASHAEVVAAFDAAATEQGRLITSRDNSSFRDQLRAIQLLGYEIIDLHGDICQPDNIPRMSTNHAERLTTRDFVSRNLLDGDLLCGSINTDNPHEAHTFVVKGRKFFDNNCVALEFQEPSKLDAEAAEFKVMRCFRIRPRGCKSI